MTGYEEYLAEQEAAYIDAILEITARYGDYDTAAYEE